jgi:hypothetical protein
LEIPFGIVFTKFTVHFGEEISDFFMLWASSSHRNLSLFFEKFELISQRNRPITRGKVLQVSPWRVGGISPEGTILGEGGGV